MGSGTQEIKMPQNFMFDLKACRRITDYRDLIIVYLTVKVQLNLIKQVQVFKVQGRVHTI